MVGAGVGRSCNGHAVQTCHAALCFAVACCVGPYPVVILCDRRSVILIALPLQSNNTI